MVWDPEFEVAFHPKTVAIVGVSRKLHFFDFVANLQNAGFSGRIYPINPRAVGEEHRGLKFYPNLVSVPEPIDLVIISTPRETVPAVLEDCIAANAKNIHIFAAGFREVGDARGIELEEKVVEIANRGGLRILGPNCMGLHVPASRITTWDELDPQSGPVAFVSQSGGHAGQFVREGARCGIRFSKVISFGNAAVLDSTDFLEYLATDPETKLICMYLEGVKDGSRFTSLVKEINNIKPVIVWKGGLTESGARAVASHTGSLGGEREVWNAFYKQTGAVSVGSMEELLDVTMAFLYLRTPASRRAALVGAGGGNSVAGADICARSGLDLPTLTEATIKELASFIPPEGTIIKNPLDIGVVLMDINMLLRSLEPIAADPLIDSIIFALPLGMLPRSITDGQADDARLGRMGVLWQEIRQGVFNNLVKFARENAFRKPIVIVLQQSAGGFSPGLQEQVQQEFLEAGISVYSSLERASRAMAKLIQYHESQKEAQWDNY